MSSDDTLLRASVGASVGMADDTEDDLGTAPTEIQVEFAHVDAKPEDDSTVSDTNIHSSGMEIDHINNVFEERNASVTLSDQVSNEITKIVPNRYTLACGTSGSDSSDQEESDPFKRQSTRVRKFSKGASLVPKESWRTRIASTRLKNAKNYISYHNISYTVPQGCNWFFQRKPPKMILNNVSGIMRVGVNAIMGPSGSGKSSLLDVLADRKDRSRVVGHVLINGEKQPHNFKCASGYVVQDDILSGTLTIKENVYLSAILRLPRDMDCQEKEKKVDEVIEELDLSHVADTLIGTPLIRGVSGGQKKRCSIAMELVVSPGILFLDEPTTGLDSTTAESVMQILHNLSKDGRVIVMSIHQPRYSIFRLCDHITLLSQGSIVYTGAGRATLPYFAEVLGLECDTFDNPPDFFMDKMSEAEVEDLELSSPETGGNALANKWLGSENCRLLNVELDQLLERAFEQPVAVATKYATNPLVQSYYLFDRAIRILFRDPSVGAAVLMLNLTLGIFSGIMFFQLENDGPNVFFDRSGALFFCMMCNMFAVNAGMEVLIGERALFIHENSSGYYCVSSYYLSKLFGDLIPLRMIPILIFSLIAYWMIGFQKNVGNFFLFMLGLFAQNLTMSGVVYSIAAAVGVLSAGQTLMNVIVVFYLVFTGFFVSLGSIPFWLSWLQWLCPFKYSFAILLENEFRDTVFCVAFDRGNCTRVAKGNDYLRQLDLLDYNIWFNFLGLALIALATMTLTYTILICIKKTK